jgi:hypothetical protein
MAESGVVLAAYKISQSISEADAFGTRLLTQGAKVTERTTQLMDQSSRSGTFNQDQVIKVLGSIASSLEQSARQIGDRRAGIEDDRKKLAAASESFTARVQAVAETASGQLRLAANGNVGRPPALEDRSQETASGAGAPGAAP